MVTKKADIYMTDMHGKDKIRITIDLSETLSIEEILNNIMYAINRNSNRSSNKLESIYFREEETI